MKKFLALLLVLVMALSFAACGDNSESNGKADGDTNQTTVNNDDNPADSGSENLFEGSKKLVFANFGYDCGAGITDDGSLYTWGYNYNCNLGYGNMGDEAAIPEKILDNVTSVSMGTENCCAITENGDLYLWGANLYSLIPGECDLGVHQSTPVKVMENVVSAYADWGCAAAVTEDGSLYVWGSNSISTNEDKLMPCKIMDNMLAVDYGNGFSAALSKNGELYTWGRNDFGQLGDGTQESSNTPKKIMDNVKSMEVYCEAHHMCALTENGELYVWGMNKDGQVGYGSDKYVLSPVKVLDDVKEVSLASYHSAAITSDNSLYMWGGAHSNIAFDNAPVPTKVLDDVLHVALGSVQSTIIKEDGFYAWGSNDRGALALNLDVDYFNFSEPTKVDFFE